MGWVQILDEFAEVRTAGTVRDALLACYQQMDLVSRELALSRSLLDRALQALDDSEDHSEIVPQIERLLVDQLGELRQSLGQVAQVPGPPREGPYPFRMDADGKAARIGERRIPLTEREFAVLELLWEEMPRPVSRKLLLDRLFGEREEQAASAADWYIFQLRQKLRNAGAEDAEIRSIRGQGWVLELHWSASAPSLARVRTGRAG